MHIIDEGHLLTEAETEAYFTLLKKHGHDVQDFKIKVTEDQKPMDMNDLNYIIVIKVKVTHSKSNVIKVYESSAESGVWLIEIEEDLKAGVFKNH